MTKKLTDILKTSTCPACGHHVAIKFFDGGQQPLATIAWPSSVAEAISMKPLPLSFVRCVNCGHVYNSDFDYVHVPYVDKPNLMFNRGKIWNQHLTAIAELLIKYLPKDPVVVEIGCGEATFLSHLAEVSPNGCFIGFDPNSQVKPHLDSLKIYNQLFDPAVHLEIYRPDLIISRHVLEHLMNPLGFLQSISFAADWLGLQTQLYIEVPCIDRVFSTGRTADFYYEHNSHFTTQSFTHLLTRIAKNVEAIEHGYGGEVIYGLAKLGGSSQQLNYANEAIAFECSSIEAKHTISLQLADLYKSGKQVAIWGGTGKSAAFINFFGADAQRFPIVVDSDIAKVGTFVPGTGQEILARDYLIINQVDVIIIPTQWRAKDIVNEIERVQIRFEQILIEHNGRLIDYFREPHPYL